jgi:hypothetical protein
VLESGKTGRKGTRVIWATAVCAVLAASWVASWVAAQQNPRGTKPRVEHKKFESGETRRVFFDDVFEVLVGSRPRQLDRPVASSAPSAPGIPPGDSASRPPAELASTGDRGWPALITATTIEDEIKAIKQMVDRDVTNPSEFRGRGYRECRRHFSIAAMLFGIITEYDDQVRWKTTAAAARDVFSRSAANAKVGSTQVFNEARQRKVDLEDILNGSTITGSREQEAENDWGRIVDRGPLMMRLEMAFDGQLQPLTATASEARSHRDRLIHEAEMTAAMAVVLVGAGMPDSDDSTYEEFAGDLKQGAIDLVKGVKENDYEEIRRSVGVIGQSCSNCHEYYRG